MNEEAEKDLTALLQVLNLPPLERQSVVSSLPYETCKRWKAYIEEIDIIAKTLEEPITTGKLPARIYFVAPEDTVIDYLTYIAAKFLGYIESETKYRSFKHKVLDIELELIEPEQALKFTLASMTAHGNA